MTFPRSASGARSLLSSLLMALLVLVAGRAPAQEILVGVQDLPPFALNDPTGAHTGMAVDLFRLAAEQAGLDYRFVALPDGMGAEEALGQVRIVLPVEAEVDLERALDLSHPIYTATLGYARQDQSGILRVLTGFLTWDFLRIIVGVVVLLLIVGTIVWAIERRSNDDMFARKPLRGLGDGFWWAGVTLTTIGYGDKAPASFWGRAVAMVWMLAGLAVSASLTAAVVSLATNNDIGGDLPDAVRGKEAVVIEGSLAAQFMRSRGLVAQVSPDAEAALALVESGEADLAVGAAPVLEWVVERDGMGLSVQTTRWDPVLLTLAMADGDELLEELNAALLSVIGSQAGQATVRRYLPDG